MTILKNVVMEQGESIFKDISAKNRKTIHFYEKHAWRTDGKTKHEVDGQAVFDEVRYVKNLI